MGRTSQIEVDGQAEGGLKSLSTRLFYTATIELTVAN
jgi:hypothetical protein